jgi:hypothetical protein
MSVKRHRFVPGDDIGGDSVIGCISFVAASEF